MDKEVDYTDKKSLKVFPAVVYLLCLSILGYVTESNVIAVFVGLSPAFISLILLFFFDPNEKHNRLIAIGSPLVLSVFFLAVWFSKIVPVISSMDGPMLAFINLFLGYFITIFFIRHRPLLDGPLINIERLSSGVKDDSSDDLYDSVIYQQKVDFDESREINLNSELDQFKKRAELAEKEIKKLRGQVAAYHHRSSQDAEKLYSLREELASQEKQADKDVDAIKRLAEIADMRAKAESDNKGKIDELRGVIAEQQEKSRSDAEEILSLKKSLVAYAHELKITKENMPKTLRSIEDKCKAINFVIGRIYADKKGGSKEIREMINIPRDWYNNFSEIFDNPKNADKEYLLTILKNIKSRLDILERQERHFLPVKQGRIEVERHRHDSVLDILDRNDKDPVREYHAEAKEICEKLLEYLDS